MAPLCNETMKFNHLVRHPQGTQCAEGTPLEGDWEIHSPGWTPRGHPGHPSGRRLGDSLSWLDTNRAPRGRRGPVWKETGRLALRVGRSEGSDGTHVAGDRESDYACVRELECAE